MTIRTGISMAGEGWVSASQDRAFELTILAWGAPR